MNAVGIDVSKGKSMVAIMRPFGEIVSTPPFSSLHYQLRILSLTPLPSYRAQATLILSFFSSPTSPFLCILYLNYIHIYLHYLCMLYLSSLYS